MTALETVIVKAIRKHKVAGEITKEEINSLATVIADKIRAMLNKC